MSRSSKRCFIRVWNSCPARHGSPGRVLSRAGMTTNESWNLPKPAIQGRRGGEGAPVGSAIGRGDMLRGIDCAVQELKTRICRFR